MQTAVLSYILGLLLCLTVATARRSLYVPNLKFSKPCENNKIDEATGNFKCMVTTGAECFKLCQAYGCYEWSFTSFMPSTSTRIHHHYRCRCAQNICLYNYVRAKDRDYTSGRGTTADRPTRACGFRAHLGQVTTTKVKNQRLPANPHSTSLTLALTPWKEVAIELRATRVLEEHQLGFHLHIRKKDLSPPPAPMGRMVAVQLLLIVTFLHPTIALTFPRRQSLYVQGLKFSRPCENNVYDEATGNFKCMVTTGAECFKLCQQHDCFEWSFSSFMASTDTQPRLHYRCRCIQDICLYNYVRARDRDYA
ncbi:unnamed protein product [Mesocestoides corti]|uniref:Apple domain-containing protein n=1 Tax=Mesocestoides corti TaxID=53468 RepID=A0A158QSX0_MESCO|nr:unnamed protein product [Mesocestoides corti]